MYEQWLDDTTASWTVQRRLAVPYSNGMVEKRGLMMAFPCGIVRAGQVSTVLRC